MVELNLLQWGRLQQPAVTKWCLIQPAKKFLIVCEIDEIKENIEALNDNLDGNEEVHSIKSKENPKILSLTLLILLWHILWEAIK